MEFKVSRGERKCFISGKFGYLMIFSVIRKTSRTTWLRVWYNELRGVAIIVFLLR